MKTIVNNQEIQLLQRVLEKPLLDFLREDLDLTGAKNGCGIGACGACTVLIDDRPVKSCVRKVKDIVDRRVLTIEGMAGSDGSLHPLQQAFIDAGAIQCGFCTPAMVLTAHAFLLKNDHPSRSDIRKAIRPVLCRCTGYQQIVDAIENAADYYAMNGAG
jgi:carbon-monoxide dehydrogenase small subunit